MPQPEDPAIREVNHTAAEWQKKKKKKKKKKDKEKKKKA
jgi:hypothetical protein